MSGEKYLTLACDNEHVLPPSINRGDLAHAANALADLLKQAFMARSRNGVPTSSLVDLGAADRTKIPTEFLRNYAYSIGFPFELPTEESARFYTDEEAGTLHALIDAWRVFDGSQRAVLGFLSLSGLSNTRHVTDLGTEFENKAIVTDLWRKSVLFPRAGKFGLGETTAVSFTRGGLSRLFPANAEPSRMFGYLERVEGTLLSEYFASNGYGIFVAHAMKPDTSGETVDLFGFPIGGVVDKKESYAYINPPALSQWEQSPWELYPVDQTTHAGSLYNGHFVYQRFSQSESRVVFASDGSVFMGALYDGDKVTFDLTQGILSGTSFKTLRLNAHTRRFQGERGSIPVGFIFARLFELPPDGGYDDAFWVALDGGRARVSAVGGSGGVFYTPGTGEPVSLKEKLPAGVSFDLDASLLREWKSGRYKAWISLVAHDEVDRAYLKYDAPLVKFTKDVNIKLYRDAADAEPAMLAICRANISGRRFSPVMILRMENDKAGIYENLYGTLKVGDVVVSGQSGRYEWPAESGGGVPTPPHTSYFGGYSEAFNETDDGRQTLLRVFVADTATNLAPNTATYCTLRYPNSETPVPSAISALGVDMTRLIIVVRYDPLSGSFVNDYGVTALTSNAGILCVPSRRVPAGGKLFVAVGINPATA